MSAHSASVPAAVNITQRCTSGSLRLKQLILLDVVEPATIDICISIKNARLKSADN